MSDPMRDLDPRSSALLSAARDGDDPSDADRARVRSAIAARVAVGVAAAAAVTTVAKGAGAGTGAAAAGVSLGLGTKVLLSLAFVGMVGVGTASYVQSTHDSPVASAVPEVAPSAAKGVARAAAPQPKRAEPLREAPPPDEGASIEAEPAPSAAPVPPAPRASRPAPTESAAAPSAGPTASTPTASMNVAEELPLFREAQAALNAGDGARALALVALHARTFPRSGLGEEREAVRVLALCAVGRVGEARAAGEAFLRTFPRSFQAARIRASCAGSP